MHVSPFEQIEKVVDKLSKKIKYANEPEIKVPKTIVNILL
jgi:hypothetical protein